MVVAFAVALLAGNEYIRQEVHLDGLVTVSFTGLAPPPDTLKEKRPGLYPYLGFGQVLEQTADIRKDTLYRLPDCSGGDSADGRLVYVYHFIYMLDAVDGIVGQRIFQRTIEMLTKYGLQCAVYQRRFTATGYAGHADHGASGRLHPPFQVISAGSVYGDKLTVAFAPLSRNGYLLQSVKVCRR